MHLFAAIRPPDNIVRSLTRLQKGVSGAKWSAPEKLHITLGYFGDVDADRADSLDLELADLKMDGFEVELSGAGHFGRSEPHAIWVGVKPSAALSRLHKHCRRAAHYVKLDMDARPFMPHITLAYLKSDPNIDRVVAFEKRLADYEAGPFLVDQFHLYSSRQTKNKPNTYQIEASYPLIGEGKPKTQ